MNIPRKLAIRLGSAGIAILLITALLVILIPARVDVTGEGRLSVTFEYKVYASPGWVSPTGNVSGAGWVDGNLAWDNNEVTYAYNDFAGSSWSSNLTLTLSAPIACDKIRYLFGEEGANISNCEIDVYFSDNETWINILSALHTSNAWTEVSIGATENVTSARIRFYNDHPSQPRMAYVYEFDFNDAGLVADITIPPPTEVNFGTVSANTSYWSLGANTTAPTTWPLTDAECYFSVNNTSSAAVDIIIKATNFTGGVAWTLAATPGVNQVTLKAGKSEDATEDAMVTLEVADQDYAFITALDASLSKKWELKMETPTEFGDGIGKESTITLTATFSS